MIKIMKLPCLSYKKGFFTVYVLFLLSIFLFFITITQIIINSKIDFFKNTQVSTKNVFDLQILDTIITTELKVIESYSKDNKILEINNFFDSDINNNKIFLIRRYEARISLGGYTIYNDGENVNYYNSLIKKLEKGIENIDIHYVKKINIDNASYSLYATINYKTNFSNLPENLTFFKIKRIWVKEND